VAERHCTGLSEQRRIAPVKTPPAIAERLRAEITKAITLAKLAGLKFN